MNDEAVITTAEPGSIWAEMYCMFPVWSVIEGEDGCDFKYLGVIVLHGHYNLHCPQSLPLCKTWQFVSPPL